MSPLDDLYLWHNPPRENPPDPRHPPLVIEKNVVASIHAYVPGRVRWKVSGLRGSRALKRALERGLAEMPGVRAVSASIETGNLLTHFNPAVPADRVSERIKALLLADIEPSACGAPDLDWHARPASAVASAFQTSEIEGLGTAVARERLAKFGANALPSPVPRSGLSIFLDQFQTLPVGLLVGAGAFSLLTGGLVEAAAILAVVGFNGVLGTVIESRSERTITSLDTTKNEPVCVVRDGATVEVAPEAIVPGDVIELIPGTVVPADARVILARDLRVSEAILTGESLPTSKDVKPVTRAAPLAERRSMVYRGTAVTGGSGRAIVVVTGRRTEMGRIQRLVGDAQTPQTPMQRQLDHLGRQLVWASLAACAAVMGAGALRGIALFQVVRSGISLAVAAIPEGLPMVATTTLALGIEDMRKRGVLVRRLDAVESLASVGVVCFDKTGTLTLNQMRVTDVTTGGRCFRTGPSGELLDADGQRRDMEGGTDVEPGTDDPLAWMLRVGVLCSDAGLEEQDGETVLTGSATEGALLRIAMDAGLDVTGLREKYPRLGVRHRTDGYRFMATAHRSPANGSDALIAVKGSPAEVLDLCTWDLRDDIRMPLTAERREAILRLNDAMASDALRVLGFAFGAVPEAGLEQDDDDKISVGGLTWIGLAGLMDPVRPGMAALMQTLHDAGLRTVMVTGDQVPTARAVARQLGLAGNGAVEVFDVAAIEHLSEPELAAVAQRANVFARVSPAQKLLIVRALQAAGERVAMTGDGINDSPALKAADVGVAMGGASSSEAARKIADIVLQTDDLATLAIAVERGRTTYVNVRKSIRYMLATNLSEILVVLAATLTGLSEPLTAMQLLWINLVGDVLPGLGLAFEPPEPELMQRPPSDAAGGIIKIGDLKRLGAQGTLIAAGSLAALGWGALRHGAGPQARTMAFGSLVTAQLLHAFTARSDRHGLIVDGSSALPPNRPLMGLLLGSVALQGVGLLVPGVRRVLGVVPLGPLDLAVTAIVGVLPYVANEALKTVPSEVPTKAQLTATLV